MKNYHFKVEVKSFRYLKIFMVFLEFQVPS